MTNENAPRVLIVDDEPDVTELLKYKLEQEGYYCKVINDPLSFYKRGKRVCPRFNFARYHDA